MDRQTIKRMERLHLFNLMLNGQEGKHWIYNTRDPETLNFYLWTRRN